MKRKATVLGGIVLAIALMGPVPAARADDFDQTEAHPLRVLAYITHPLGVVAEWLIFRPFHAFVSLPYVEDVFGHREHND